MQSELSQVQKDSQEAQTRLEADLKVKTQELAKIEMSLADLKRKLNEKDNQLEATL